MQDTVSVVGDLLKDGFAGLALEDDVLLHQGLGAAPHCDAVGPERMDPVLYYLGETVRACHTSGTPGLVGGGQVRGTAVIKRRGKSMLGRAALWHGKSGKGDQD